MNKKTLTLTMDELLTVVKSEVIQLDSRGRESLTIIIDKSVCYDNNTENIHAKIVREDKND